MKFNLTKFRFLASYLMIQFAALLLFSGCQTNPVGVTGDVLTYQVTASNQRIEVVYFNGLDFDTIVVDNEMKQINLNMDFFDAKIRSFNPNHFTGDFDLYPVINDSVFIELALFFNGRFKTKRLGKYNAMIEVYKKNEIIKIKL